MKIKIDKIKKETLIFTGLTIFLILFSFLGYIPQKNSVESLKLKVTRKEKRRKKIKSILSAEKEKGVVKIKSKVEEAKDIFPTGSNAIIKYISGRVHDLGLNIISLTPQKEKNVKIDSKVVTIKKKVIYKLPIKIEFKSKFEKLTEYLEWLILESPYLINVQQATLNKITDSKEIIDVELKLISYYKSD